MRAWTFRYSRCVVALIVLGIAVTIAGRNDVRPPGEHANKTEAPSLEEQIRKAVAAGASRQRMMEYIATPPGVDIQTQTGRNRHSMAGLGLDLETAYLLQSSGDFVYWVLDTPSGYPPVLGIVWDVDGKPHLFQGKIVP